MSDIINKVHQHILNGASVSTDTRQIKENSVFFALKGENFDANQFAEQALEKGALCAIVDDQNLPDHDQIVKVDNVLETLQELAHMHRNLFHIPVIGITGSNGKTTTKELVNAVLSGKYATLCTEGNLNNHIGVPITLLRLHSAHEIAIVEMGANHVGEIASLANLTRPGAGLITNIGKAHIEGFGSLENIVKAKTELYEFLRSTDGTIFVNKGNEILMSHLDEGKCITYGASEHCQYLGRIESTDPFLHISFRNPDEESENGQWIEVESKLLGTYNFENIMAAVAIGLHFGVDPARIKEAIENYLPRNNRSQLKHTKHNTIYMDAYNANPSSMLVALDNFVQLKTTLKKGLILGDMLELGKVSPDEHQKVVERISEENYSLVILVGVEFSRISFDKPDHFHVFENTEQASAWLTDNAVSGYTLLIKGSRGIQLERLEDQL